MARDARYDCVVPFPVRLLSADEEVAVETRPHWTYLAGQLGVFTVIGVAAIVVAALGFPLPAIVVAAALAGVAAVAFGIRLARWASTYYLVTDHRIVYWKGLPHWRGIELSLELVDEIDGTQTFWGRLFGVGTLSVRSVIEGHVRNLAFVPQPGDVRREVYRLLGEADRRARQRFEPQQPPEAPGPAAGSDAPGTHGAPGVADVSLDIPDQIRKLWELVELGILSPGEFEQKKQDLLRRL